MPLETDSNVNDEAAEQQESHIDLINETAKMKHLASTGGAQGEEAKGKTQN